MKKKKRIVKLEKQVADLKKATETLAVLTYRASHPSMGEGSKSVPDFLYGENFRYLNKLFTAEYQGRVVHLVKIEGVRMGAICSALRIGATYYPAISAIVKAYEKSVG